MCGEAPPYSTRRTSPSRQASPERRRGLRHSFIRTGIDDVVADVSAGVEVLDLRGASVKLFYDGRFGDTIQENAAGAKATVPF